MEQHYIGVTPFRLGTITLKILQDETYMRFFIQESFLGMKWNSIEFLLTPNEYNNMINRDIGFCLLSTGGKSKIIYQVNKLRIKVTDSNITEFHINFTESFEENGFFTKLLGLDTITLSGIKLEKVLI